MINVGVRQRGVLTDLFSQVLFRPAKVIGYEFNLRKINKLEFSVCKIAVSREASYE